MYVYILCHGVSGRPGGCGLCGCEYREAVSRESWWMDGWMDGCIYMYISRELDNVCVSDMQSTVWRPSSRKKPEDIFGGLDGPGRVACFTSSGMVAVSSPSILVRFSFDSDSSAAAPFCEEERDCERESSR